MASSSVVRYHWRLGDRDRYPQLFDHFDEVRSMLSDV